MRLTFWLTSFSPFSKPKWIPPSFPVGSQQTGCISLSAIFSAGPFHHFQTCSSLQLLSHASHRADLYFLSLDEASLIFKDFHWTNCKDSSQNNGKAANKIKKPCRTPPNSLNENTNLEVLTNCNLWDNDSKDTMLMIFNELKEMMAKHKKIRTQRRENICRYGRNWVWLEV